MPIDHAMFEEGEAVDPRFADGFPPEQLDERQRRAAERRAEFDQLLRRGAFRWVNPLISASNFPILPELCHGAGLKPVEIGEEMTLAKIEAIFAKKRLRPARLEELVAFAAVSAIEKFDFRSRCLVALGSPLLDGESECVPCVYEADGKRRLTLTPLERKTKWKTDHVFLGSII